MKITPKTETEVMQNGLLAKGEYPFVVKSAVERTSKSGNPMIAVMLTLWDEKGREHTVFDYLMESIEYKLRHFFYAIGMGGMYESGDLVAEMALDKQGICKVYIQEDKSGQYPPKNAVADYLVEASKDLPMKPLPETKEEFNDDIPF